MSAANRKPRSDSAAAAVAAALAAASPLPQCPKHIRLRECDKPFWESLLRARTRAEWSEDQLVIAAQLARCQCDIEIEAEELHAEGTVIRNDRGTLVANPRVSILEQLSRRQMSLMRSMGLCGVPALGDKRNLQKDRQLEKGAAQAHKDVQDEDADLLA